MTTTHQHFTTIAEFMGWEYDYDDFLLEESFVRKDPHWPDFYPANSFDTMRMVFDKLRERFEELPDHVYQMQFYYYERHDQAVSMQLSHGTPIDCAARLAEGIEWWKTVKQ